MLFAVAASAVSPMLGDADIKALWTMSASLLTAAAAKLLHAGRSAQPAASKSVSDSVVEIETTGQVNEPQPAVVSR